ncbi:helix-turn-helix domain-containing protein [Mesobacillus maritimus]|uniref:helix-turn-helix domain-containing protein n=1 Tax=Mesobacillus maritimus TaxID=1643336 RepID=UPI00203AAC7D|nr:helix-turn-helix domain-containing protein [Mesobacillus maritimus]MCM3585533.1 helix-turn-helix domain-containing protein [Mesobacillus maritimus]MCM3669793.1 helix-turn-helix domain-containing protein [Mesobacillus maritimus]
MLVGERIKKLRLQKNYSITELANQSNVSKSYLSYIERGIQENPSLQVLMRLANTLCVSLEELTGIPPIEQDHVDFPLDNEWLDLIDEAVRSGISKEEFSLYIDLLKYRKKAIKE